jgi:3-oxoacyl-[acyl-carrier-protein] synthase III
MIGIKAIASYIPKKVVDNTYQALKFDEDKNFIENKIGALFLPRKEDDQESSDLSLLAFEALLENCPDLKKDLIDAIVVVTQNPDGDGLPHSSAILQRKLGLPYSVAAFDVSLGCSGYVYGLFILKGFLEASGLKNGILFTSDQYSKIIDPDDRVTTLLFGDAATATWVGENPNWILNAVQYGTNGNGSEFLKSEYGYLHMNGRQVFNFAITQVAPHIKDLLERQKLLPKDIDMFCLHQGSAAIVNSIARQFGDIATRFPVDMKSTGNTVSSSIPLLLENNGFKSDAKRIIISGFGVGFSWASALISKVN